MSSTSPTQAFTGGKFHDAISGQTFDTLEPATGKVLAAVSACGPEDVDQAVAAARAAFEDGRWSRVAPDERKKVLLRLADLVEAHAGELARRQRQGPRGLRAVHRAKDDLVRAQQPARKVSGAAHAAAS